MKFKYLVYPVLFILFFAHHSNGFSQFLPSHYWVQFTDKHNTPYSIATPGDYLSPAALERRDTYNIAIDSLDIPVNPAYLDSLTDYGLEVAFTSKWLNGCAVTSNDNQLFDNLSNAYTFIDTVFVIRYEFIIPSSPRNENVFSYGQSGNQLITVNGQTLHNAGYHGQGMQIAILDSGFESMNSLPAFDSLYTNDQIMATRDMYTGNEVTYDRHPHGTYVMSILAGNLPDSLVGSAPKANYILIRTEDADSEQIIEEFAWAAGAEFADSLGAELLNVSLGYREYDVDDWNYGEEDIDGNTAWISRAATIAARKGMLVAVAAGNNGNEDNPMIGVPADADSVITLGATQADSSYAPFSSVGPTADQRIKPDIVSQGQADSYQNLAGEVATGSGTSFSTPVICGLSACLWQANPQANSHQLRQAIIQSAHLYDTPNDSLGHGLPDFEAAHAALQELSAPVLTTDKLQLYPNPTHGILNIPLSSVHSDKIRIEIYHVSGSLMRNMTFSTRTEVLQLHLGQNFPPGIYLVRLHSGDNTRIGRFILN